MNISVRWLNIMYQAYLWKRRNHTILQRHIRKYNTILGIWSCFSFIYIATRPCLPIRLCSMFQMKILFLVKKLFSSTPLPYSVAHRFWISHINFFLSFIHCFFHLWLTFKPLFKTLMGQIKWLKNDLIKTSKSKKIAFILLN